MMKAEIVSDVKVELRLVPGLPSIRFLGLPDASLRESELRIRSALRASGYQFPKGRMLLVDVMPREEKKHGRGLDLPVAIGFLLLTGQAHLINWEDKVFYGDISLGGQVTAPADWVRAGLYLVRKMVTGEIGREIESDPRSLHHFKDSIEVVKSLADLKFEKLQTKSRSDLATEIGVHSTDHSDFFALSSHLRFCPKSAKIAALSAAGGHPTLLAGPQGSGKSTLARAIHYLRPNVGPNQLRELELWSGKSERPILEPHHSASVIAMVGGGSPVRPGLVTRAHLGSLLMDEVLLFRPEVQESLREPLETGRVCLARGTESRTLPADFQLIGTANLCQCGRWTPDQPEQCTCSSRVRNLYEGKLRGPFVDRFQILAFTSCWQASKGEVQLEEIRKQVELAVQFQRSMGRIDNRRWYPSEAEVKHLGRMPSTGSERRRIAMLRVARTMADLDLREAIQLEDLQLAAGIALDTFQALQNDSR